MSPDLALVLALDGLAHDFARLDAQEGAGGTQGEADEAQGHPAPPDASGAVATASEASL